MRDIGPVVLGCAGRHDEASIHRLFETAAGSGENPERLSHLAELEQAVTGQPLFSGNEVTLLVDGPETYREVFGALRKAKHHIHIETYILADDEIGQLLAAALIERRRAGVEVRVIYDSVGSLTTSETYFEALRTAGVQVHEYHPLNPLDDLRIWRINRRTHRKIIVIDGEVGFAGGINFSSVYRKSSFQRRRLSRDLLGEAWRDTHARIEGPAVAELQRLFLETWCAETGNWEMDLDSYFPVLDRSGEHLVRVVSTYGGHKDSDVYEAYLSVILQARRRIWITQAYFVPNDEVLNALCDAAGRGVDVRLLLPEVTDAWVVQYSSRSFYGALLRRGVRIYLRKGALLHAKTAVVDGSWSTVGSSNIDPRSFLHNDEVNVTVLGSAFARNMESLFLRDLEHSRLLRLAEWRDRPWTHKFRERLARLFKYWF